LTVSEGSAVVFVIAEKNEITLTDERTFSHVRIAETDAAKHTKGGENHMALYYRIALSFTRFADEVLVAFALKIIKMMTGNVNFQNPKPSLADLQAGVDAFSNAMAASEDSGKAGTAAKNAAREALIGLLRVEANYVEGEKSTDLSALLSSGFDTVKTDHTQIPLPKPVIDRIENPGTTQIGLRLQPVPTARAYEVRISYGTNGWQAVGVFTQSRQILIENLTPGTTYSIQARAVGGTTGYSDWSDPVSHMSM
jgi:hypothetical protein